MNHCSASQLTQAFQMAVQMPRIPNVVSYSIQQRVAMCFGTLQYDCLMSQTLIN